MSFRPKSLAFIVVAALVAACSSDPQRPPPAGEGSTISASGGGGGGGGGGDGGATDAGTDVDSGAVCNSLANSSLVVDRIGVVGEPPVSTGGTIQEGRYELTEYRIFVGAGGVGGPTGVTAKSAMTIAAGKMEQVLEIGGNTPTTEKRVITSFNATASTLLRTNICPSDGAAAQYQFTANDAAITITDSLSKEAFVFTKR